VSNWKGDDITSISASFLNSDVAMEKKGGREGERGAAEG